ncbi:phage shock protein C (PspC) family protein [Alteribacillus persepolensis]|uniref:Phage shock protein C (PspC) family protein n=1 Tax=Alteribacillus persepolensis TaxID=568899 RepID=A0A1G8EAR0_9BACI|nr:PspC domain-containing protein [Alteribacillus persepolensis]SDH66779.1 phage shock protein C (PspC) family protein [Alteribacillus persepolensis]
MNSPLQKSSSDRSLWGVCGGIAEYFGVSSLMTRILFIVIPASLFVYIVLANLMPDRSRLL